MKKEVDFQGQCSSQNNIQSHPEQLFLQQHMQQNSDNHMNIFGGHPQPWSINHEPLFLVPPTPYTSLFNTRVPSSSHHQHLWINISDNTYGSKLSAQEIIEAKALAASKSHSEAERRRRERINNHLAKLRTMLPNTTKIDKASLLAEVINHVKELKRQTSLIAETSEMPSESDELKVDGNEDENGHFVIKASLCCEDRSDLLHDLIKTLKALRFRTLKAEITTLAGRVKNVLFITEDLDNGEQHYACINSVHEALKEVMKKSTGGHELDYGNGNVKRRRRIRD